MAFTNEEQRKLYSSVCSIEQMLSNNQRYKSVDIIESANQLNVTYITQDYSTEEQEKQFFEQFEQYILPEISSILEDYYHTNINKVCVTYGCRYTQDRTVKTFNTSVEKIEEVDVPKVPSSYVKEFQNFLQDHKLFCDVDVCDNDKNSVCVNIDWGDWKHEHLYLKTLAKQFFEQKGISVNIESETTEEDSSDTFSAIHTISSAEQVIQEDALDDFIVGPQADELVDDTAEFYNEIRDEGTPEFLTNICYEVMNGTRDVQYVSYDEIPEDHRLYPLEDLDSDLSQGTVIVIVRYIYDADTDTVLSYTYF